MRKQYRSSRPATASKCDRKQGRQITGTQSHTIKRFQPAKMMCRKCRNSIEVILCRLSHFVIRIQTFLHGLSHIRRIQSGSSTSVAALCRHHSGAIIIARHLYNLAELRSHCPFFAFIRWVFSIVSSIVWQTEAENDKFRVNHMTWIRRI